MCGRPTKFEFYVGGYTGTSHHLKLENDTLVCDLFAYGHVPACTRLVTPTEVEWTAFREVLERIKPWAWQERYDDSGVLDGTSWSFEWEDGDRKARSSGSNDFPEKDACASGSNGGHAGDDPFEELCEAIRNLTGGAAFDLPGGGKRGESD